MTLIYFDSGYECTPTFMILLRILNEWCIHFKKSTLFIIGVWLGSDCLDGVKLVCMDKIYDNIKSGKCLVYSFGLSMDWSFERAMAAIGCTVRAFDPTQDQPESVTHKRIHFQKIGLGHKTENQQVCHFSFVWEIFKYLT